MGGLFRLFRAAISPSIFPGAMPWDFNFSPLLPVIRSYPLKTRNLILEPPGADPQAGWCGGPEG